MIFHAIRMNFLCRNYTERKAMKNNVKHHLKYMSIKKENVLKINEY